METISHKRSKGLGRTYDISYDAAGYEIRHDGELKKRARTPVVIKGPTQSIAERLELSKWLAIQEIEGLLEMDE